MRRLLRILHQEAHHVGDTTLEDFSVLSKLKERKSKPLKNL
jgi:hypothetical protein